MKNAVVETLSAALPEEQPPESVQWQARRTLKSRLFSAVSVPFVAATVVLIVTTVITIAVVWAQPHMPGESVANMQKTPPTEEQQSSTGDTQGSTQPKVKVHVIGEVHSPGVVELPEGSRIEDAIEAAGGQTESADLSSVNLARALGDGEQLVVLKLGEAATSPETSTSGAQEQLISLNLATAAQLEQLPRVGPAMANRIVAWRDDNGGFTEIEQLLNVEGIGKKTFEQLLPLVKL